tara:strand:+ start:1411 stop:2328 length:918 start_codon:yes stop_codon:yes gene_type:complete
MFTKKSVLVIPTKDRNTQLKKTLNQFLRLKVSFKKIIVVDSSTGRNLKENKFFLKNKNIQHIYSQPSISKQRNIGIDKALKIKSADYIFLLDDDIIFKKKAFKEINKEIIKNKGNKQIIGFGFNPKNNFTKNWFDKIKESKISKIFGLYHEKQGKILESGWQTKIQNVKKNLRSNWASTAALVLKLDQIKDKRFDESFGKYSYLEDLDFSLKFKPNIFLIVSKACFFHYNNIERTSFKFGFIEVVNRFKVVKKNKLSFFSYFKMIILKTIMNLIYFAFGKFHFLMRFIGNLNGIIYIIFFGLFIK